MPFEPEDEPKISVVMPAFNEERTIERAIKSILEQTYENFEFIIVDDGSTDKTDEVLDKFIDTRIKIVTNKFNIGVTKSMNIGIRASKGKYIARMDADDYCFPERIERQLEFLEAHPSIAVLGTACYLKDSIRGEEFVRVFPLEDSDIKKEMAKYISICQGSVMMRRQAVVQAGLYNEEYSDIEDLELWTRMGVKYKFANLEMPLYVYDLRQETSFFHNRYSPVERNLKLVKLSIRAIRRFNLPIYYYVFPVSRLLYPFLPRFIKRVVRRGFSKIKERGY